MAIGPLHPDVYTDFQGLTTLRAAARQDAPAALPQAARQFEAYFIQLMLKSMRDTLPGDDLLGSDQGDFYRDLMDRQVSVSLAAKNSLGLADMLVRQLTAARHMLPRSPAAGEETPEKPGEAMPDGLKVP